MREISLNSNIIPKSKSHKQFPQWINYFGLGIIGNVIVWGLVFVYLKYIPTTYTSQWAIMILGDATKSNIDLPDLGRASSESNFVRVPEYQQDPRNDYLYFSTSPQILSLAAEKMEMSSQDFGEPEVTLNPKSAVMIFNLQGATPEQAKQKSKVLYETIAKEIERLRQIEVKRREKKIEATLKSAEEKLSQARKKLADYKSKSIFRSDEQIQNISSNLEQLRRQYSELMAQEKGLNVLVRQLSRDLQSLDQNNDAYILQTDQVFQQYFALYGQISSKLAGISSSLQAEHPMMIQTKAELQDIMIALQNRGSFLLAKPATLKDLITLSSYSLDPQTVAIRNELFNKLVTSRADYQAILAHNLELTKQIAILENNLKTLVSQQTIIKQLEVDIKVAEGVFATSSTKLDIDSQDVDDLYPPFQLVVAPSLPDIDKPTFPDKKITLLGGLAASFLVITGLIFLWWDRQIVSNTELDNN